MASGGKQDYRAFVSALSSECEKARDGVANDLQSFGLHVGVQRSIRLKQGLPRRSVGSSAMPCWRRRHEP